MATAIAASFAAERFAGDPLFVAGDGDTIGVVAAMTVVAAANAGFCAAVGVAAAAAAFAASRVAVVGITAPLGADSGNATPGTDGAWFAVAAVPTALVPAEVAAAAGNFVVPGVVGALVVGAFVVGAEADGVDASCGVAVSRDAKSVGGAGAALLGAIGISEPVAADGAGATAGAAGRVDDVLGVGTAFASALDAWDAAWPDTGLDDIVGSAASDDAGCVGDAGAAAGVMVPPGAADAAPSP